MASKLPFKIFDWKRKLQTFSIRLNKTIKHKILSKSRNALIINSNTYNKNNTNQNFKQKLTSKLIKTWDISQVNSTNIFQQHKQIEKRYQGKQFDAIIVIPQSNRQIKQFYDISSQQFVTNLQNYQQSLYKNLLAYRLAHKCLATSGVLIYSNSQSDFAKIQSKGQIIVQQPALKKVLQAQLSYLNVVIGDRDYTDLNSWSLVGLSQQHLKTQNQDYVVQMYADWANGLNLPMPGSFAFFKIKQQGKKAPFVQYL